MPLIAINMLLFSLLIIAISLSFMIWTLWDDAKFSRKMWLKEESRADKNFDLAMKWKEKFQDRGKK